MTYIVTKSDGTTLTTIAQSDIDTDSCSLSLIGRKAINYGQSIAENFVRLLENSSSDTAPSNPLKGQFWFEKTDKNLKIYDGTSWFTIISVTADGSNVTGSQLISTAVSPLPPMTVASSVKVDGLNADLLDGYNTSITSSPNTIPVRNGSSDIYANKFQGIATSAQYADLAERFEASEGLEPGDVVAIGGEKEICKATDIVLGVISENPGFRMNEDAGDDSTHPFVAYVGRVPVKVTGVCAKGDLLKACGNGLASVTGLGQDVGRALADKVSVEVGLVLTVVGAK